MLLSNNYHIKIIIKISKSNQNKVNKNSNKIRHNNIKIN